MTTIEWARNADGTEGKSWNPIRAREKKSGKRGWHCEHVHEGCRFCYSERQNVRPGNSGGTGLPFKPGHRDDVEIYLDEKALIEPLKWKRPQRVFVCSMSDLFGEWVPDLWLDKIRAVQQATPRHTYIELTKRPARMRLYNSDRSEERAENRGDFVARIAPALFSDRITGPLPNVWSLVSCSTQEDADEFLPIMMQTETARRGVSLEPLLGPVHLGYLGWPGGETLTRTGFNALIGAEYADGRLVRQLPKLDWVIAGGESGPTARAMQPEWLRGLRDQCKASDVRFFFKQWGEWAPYDRGRTDSEKLETPGALDKPMQRFGKKLAGRTLDGVEHSEWPEVVAP